MPKKRKEKSTDEVLRLQEIIDTLPDHAENIGQERREHSLTKGDVVLIYKIATIAAKPHVCPFEGETGVVLHTVASSITQTQKIAFRLFVTAVVTGVLAGIWYGVVHMAKDFVGNVH